MTYPKVGLVLLMVLSSVTVGWGATFKVEQDEHGVTVLVDGQLMTRYRIDEGPKPFLWPVVGPTGKEMTRGYPMRDASPTERADHKHHRSMWFTHGNVNGIDFWTEGEGHGLIRHREFVTVRGGDTAVIVTRNDWLSNDGSKKICHDQQAYVFGADQQSRWIDAAVTITAGDKPVTFGDTKEGTFGVRVAGTMKVDAKMGGRIINSEGQTDKEAWGKKAAWVDYYGPVEGETLGIAILNHPSSFRFPTYWHVRTYGLFAANPFGWHHFLNDSSVDGSLQLAPGESFTVRYRVLLHQGDVKAGKVAEAFERYAASKPAY